MSSRFALLDIDVDLDDRIGKKKNSEKSKKEDTSKKTQNKSNKKKKGDTKDDSLHSLAFGPTGKSNKGKKKGDAKCKSPDKDRVNSPAPAPAPAPDSIEVNGANSVDEDWKRRDDEFVQDENERVLREALMLSKLDFEEKKDFYAVKKKEQEEESKRGKVKKKKAGPITMSLGEFNDLLTKKEDSPTADIPAPQEIAPEEETFFDDIDEATRKTLEREQRKENYRATAGQFSQEVRATQYEAEIEKRDFEIQALRLEVESLKDDLKLVKNRNKKLCEVICSAEMKAKAELVVEIDKMTKVRDELTNEVMKLSQELEQERSKVHQLTQESRKSHGKKKHNSESTKD